MNKPNQRLRRFEVLKLFLPPVCRLSLGFGGDSEAAATLPRLEIEAGAATVAVFRRDGLLLLPVVLSVVEDIFLSGMEQENSTERRLLADIHCIIFICSTLWVR